MRILSTKFEGFLHATYQQIVVYTGDLSNRIDLTLCKSVCKTSVVGESPGGAPPLYQVYRYVPPQRVWFLSRFGLKTSIDFEHFGLKLGMVIGGTFTKAYKTYSTLQQPGRVTGQREREIDKIYHPS